MNAFFTKISLPPQVNPEKFIGREGFHLKRITELSRVDYIWLDFATLDIEVWSYNERYIPKALRMLGRRIEGLLSQQQPGGAPPSKKKVEIEATHVYPRTVAYVIKGEESQCLAAFEGILKEYPFNPYFTRMKSKRVDENGVTVLEATRAESSD